MSALSPSAWPLFPDLLLGLADQFIEFLLLEVLQVDRTPRDIIGRCARRQADARWISKLSINAVHNRHRHTHRVHRYPSASRGRCPWPREESADGTAIVLTLRPRSALSKLFFASSSADASIAIVPNSKLPSISRLSTLPSLGRFACRPARLAVQHEPLDRQHLLRITLIDHLALARHRDTRSLVRQMRVPPPVVQRPAAVVDCNASCMACRRTRKDWHSSRDRSAIS